MQALEMASGELNAELLVRLSRSCWHGFFRTNVIIAIVLKKLWTQDWSNGPKIGQTVSKG